MSTDRETQKSEAIEQVAADWFARQQSGQWAAADQHEFDSWLDAAVAHRIHYIRITATWNNAARLKALGAGLAPGTIPERRAWGDTRFFGGTRKSFESSAFTSNDRATVGAGQFGSKRRTWRALAASVLLVSAIGTAVFFTDYFRGARYSTAVGGLDTVALEDGSKVTLNTDSRIRVAVSETQRRIDLERGEVFFDVAKDPTRPFIVYAGDRRVMALGTKFSVRREDDEVQVIVAEGRVNLGAADTPVTPKRTAGSSAGDPLSIPEATLLNAGAIARTSRSEVLVRPDAAAEVEKLLSWRKGFVSFDNMPLADAVAEFNRYNTRKIVIEDPAIAAIRVGGNFRSNNAGAFLDLLENGFPITVEQDDDRVILRSR